MITVMFLGWYRRQPSLLYHFYEIVRALVAKITSNSKRNCFRLNRVKVFQQEIEGGCIVSPARNRFFFDLQMRIKNLLSFCNDWRRM